MKTQQPATPGPGAIGLLYPGEMGAALAAVLRGAGYRLVTTLEGRGPKTRRNCRELGLEELDTLRAVVQTASVLITLVPPAAALPAAAACREQLGRHRPPGDRLLYVDLNSVAPGTARQVAAVFAGVPVDFVDGAISGPASHLCSRGVMYLSGAAAGQVAPLFGGVMRVQVLGESPGQASALRMLLSGLTKGVVALFVELAVAARRAGVQDNLLAAYQASYPGVMELVDRSLPTFPRHAARRGTEMQEVEATLADLGLCPTVVPGVRQLIAEMARCWPADGPDKAWSVAEVIETLHARELLVQGRVPARP
jgi:3-hydroxyisobutyrate dehydrogenase-like beta-hydroxyacid dehydrogenase